MSVGSSLRALAAALLVTACQSGGPPPPERFDPASCTGNWRVVHTPAAQPMMPPPGDLSWHAGRLYFKQHLTAIDGIWSVPAAGGELVRVDERFSWWFWPEDDHLIIVARRELLSLPLAGGVAEPVLRIPALDDANTLWVQWALERDSLYWVQWDLRTQDLTMWRVTRVAGAAPRILGRLPERRDHIMLDELIVADDDLVLTSLRTGLDPSEMLVVPKAGGPLRGATAVRNARIIGLATDGEVLWRTPYDDGETGYRLHRSTVAVPVGEPIWSTQPPHSYPARAWKRPDGTWYLAVREPALGDDRKLSLWTLDATGHARRIACDPELDGTVTAGVAAPDGLYLSVAHGAERRWKLVAVAR
jgi:hypothetical protein